MTEVKVDHMSYVKYILHWSQILWNALCSCPSGDM